MEWEEHLLLFSRDIFKKRKTTMAGSDNTLFFFAPIGPKPADVIITLLENFNEIEFHRIPEQVTEDLRKREKFLALNIEIFEDRDNWDYVYEGENLRNLPGNRYRQNRRWLNKFLENYDYKFEILTEEKLPRLRNFNWSGVFLESAKTTKVWNKKKKPFTTP